MSDIMRPMDFGKMMKHILGEYKLRQQIFNVQKIFTAKKKEMLTLLDGQLENPIGPAAGPHTQLAQNIVACYAAGGRFFELKTVQVLYGEDLGIPRPCINSRDEAYNVEWSSEFTTKEAMEEYIKAWYALKLISKEFSLGNPEGFIFNMSVGYNLEGIQSKSVDIFINGLKEARNTEIWKECEQWAKENLNLFSNVDESYLHNITSKVCSSVTLSTMHGCPAEEIEAITSYLIEEKKLNTYLKCNPTLLGYEFTRNTLDQMGYDYLVFDDSQFRADLKFEDAVPMIKSLQKKAEALGLSFGVKLSNTFPVCIKRGELPGEHMYMSGKTLYPLAIAVAAKLSKAFEGKLSISFSGGADKNNIEEIFSCGIFPITICTVLLKGTGFDQMTPLAQKLEALPYQEKQEIDIERLSKLSNSVPTDVNYCKTEVARKKYDEKPSFPDYRDEGYHCKILCKSCVRVCPNRANEVIELEAEKLILHIDASCNECGNCACGCIEPCQPYKDRITYFENLEDLKNSDNIGFCKVADLWAYRFEGEEATTTIDKLPTALKGVVDAMKKQHPYYLV